MITLKDAGVKVYLIKQPPETSNANSARSFYLSQKFKSLNSPIKQFTTSIKEYNDSQENFKKSIMNNEFENLIIFDPVKTFFPEEQERLKVYSNQSYYRDKDHLTQHGVNQLMSPLLERIFKKIAYSQE